MVELGDTSSRLMAYQDDTILTLFYFKGQIVPQVERIDLKHTNVHELSAILVTISWTKTTDLSLIPHMEAVITQVFFGPSNKADN